MNITIKRARLTTFAFFILIILITPISIIGCREPAEKLVMAHPAHIYTSACEMLSDSDLVVIGVFNNEEQLVPDGTPINNAYPGWRELSFKVTDTIKGISEPQIWVAQHVTFKANGAVSGPYEGDTLFKPESKYILFLNLQDSNPNVPHNGEFYWLTGSTQCSVRNEVTDAVATWGPI